MPENNEMSIITDVNEKIQGETNIQRSMLIVLKHILIELRILNNRTGDHGDISVMKGAEQARKSILGGL